MREICLVCPKIVCVDEKKGRRIFFTDRGSTVVEIPIGNCDTCLSVAILGMVAGRTVNNNVVYTKTYGRNS
jgi:hypothetical protein